MSIDYGVLPGTRPAGAGRGRSSTSSCPRFPHEDGAEMPSACWRDSGYNTQTVYSWCRKYPMNRVIAVKGQASGGVLIGTPSPVDINMRGKRPVYGYKVWPVCGGVAKSEVYGWLRLDPPTNDEAHAPGFCHFPEYDDDYFRQLTAEHLVSRKTKRGFVSLEWELIPGRENHVLDARVYARAAASLVGLDRWQEVDWAAHERALSPDQPPAPPARPRGEPWLRRRVR